MPETVEIGLGRSARRGYHLDDIALVPTRRTRGSAVVSTHWQIDAHAFDLPFVAAPSDATVSPATAAEIERLGGLAVLDGEGLWTRYEDPAAQLAKLDADTAVLQRVYARPVSAELLRARIAELRAAKVRVAVRLSPQHTAELAPHALAEGVDLLVIQGTVISAEHVVRQDTPGLNLKTFIADLDVPVLVGGVTNYQTALHLMRTGAAGVIIGYGAHAGSTTHAMLGIDVPMATALVDAAAARRDYLDETGRALRAPRRLRRHLDRRRDRQGARLRCRRRDARRAARRRGRGAGRRALLGPDRGAPAGAALDGAGPLARCRRPAEPGGTARRPDGRSER